MSETATTVASSLNGSATGSGSGDGKPLTPEKPKEIGGKVDTDPAPSMGDADRKVLESVQKSQEEFLTILSRPSPLKKLWQRRVWATSNPELLKVYGVIYNHLVEAQRLLTLRMADPTDDSDLIRQQLHHLLDNRHKQALTTNIHAAWEYAAALERMLLLLGDKNYIVTRLENEVKKVEKKLPGAWSQYLPGARLTGLLDAYKGDAAKGDAATEVRKQAVESLALLYALRSSYLRHQRAREEIKADYLNRLTVVLTILLLLLLETIYLVSKEGAAAAELSRGFWDSLRMLFTLDFKFDFTDQNVRNALVAAMTGALGSTLSGFYKLRDETDGIAALRSFRWAMWAQPFVGATVGVLLMLLIMSGLLAIGTTGGAPEMKWLSLSVYCFLAGFSEPFFLGVVQRVAGAVDKKTLPAAGAGGQGGRGQ